MIMMIDLWRWLMVVIMDEDWLWLSVIMINDNRLSWMMIKDDSVMMILITLDLWWFIMRVMIDDHNYLDFDIWSWLLIGLLID